MKNTQSESLVFAAENVELLNEVIDLSLRAYLGFPVSELFPDGSDPVIFGGAIRDALAGDTINDLDIITAPVSFAKVSIVLKEKGFEQVPTKIEDYHCMPFGITRVRKEETTIDLIRLKMSEVLRKASISIPDQLDAMDVKKAIVSIISNVDIRACGVGFSAKSGLLEFIKGAVDDCILREIKELPDNLMHLPGRSEARIAKLLQRGWSRSKSDKTNIPTAMGF